MSNVQSWQNAILKHQFPLTLEDNFDPRSHTGYLSAELNGESSGFEYSYEAVNQQAEATFTTFSDEAELLSSVIASAVLTALTGGTLEETQEGETFSDDVAI